MFFLFLLVFGETQAQNTKITFGKNRLQHKTFRWKHISTKHFNIYYYDGGNSLAHNAARYAETNYESVSSLIGYPSYSRINLIVYNSVIDLQQSNIGLGNAQFIGGETELIKAKIEIGFTGSHIVFREDIKTEIANLLINQMMYGGTFKEMVQASYLLNLPDWFTGGAAAYIGKGWTVEMETVVRDILLNRRNGKPSKLNGKEAIVAGQSFWNYIAKSYGKSTIANILNLTSILRDEEAAITSALGTPYSLVISDWRRYYLSKIKNGQTIEPSKKNRLQRIKLRPYKNQNIAYNKDSTLIAYGENFDGRVRVKIYNFKTKKSRVVFTGGYRLSEQKINYKLPLVAWRSSKELSILYYKKGKPYLVTKNLNTRKKELKKFITFDDIHSFHYCGISDDMVLSGVKEGRSDIYVYDYKKDRARQITRDIYGDFNPYYIPNTKKIVWSSNRQNDTLRVGLGAYGKVFNHYKLFVYNDDTKEKVLQRLVDAEVSALQPIALTETNYYFLGEIEHQRQIYHFNSRTDSIYQVSHFENNVQSFAVGKEESKLFYTFKTRNKDYIYEENLFSFSGNHLGFQRIKADEEVLFTERKLSLHEKILQLDASDYTFESDTLKQKRNAKIEQEEKGAERKNKLKIRRPKHYASLMGIDYVASTYVMDQLRGGGLLFNFGTSEMFGDHKFTANLLLFSDLKSSSFGLSYQFLKKREDLKLKFDRYSMYNANELVFQRYTKNEVELEMAHPFSVSSRVSVAPFFTSTRFINLNIIERKDNIHNYFGGRVKYVLDNTKNMGLNMLVGSRGLALLETHQSTQGKAFSFSKFVLDFRTYKRIHKQMILALRGSYGQFFGQSKKNFMLGGMDSWFFAKSNKQGIGNPLNIDSPLDHSAILFHEFATSVRGFDYNETYGDKFIVFNAELRVPIVRILQNGPIASSFFKNLQLTSFYDLGSAWRGRTPFTEDNNLNTTFTKGNGFTSKTVNYLNPFLQSYGFGMRSLVYGYYLKLDLAWGVKNYVVRKPRLLLSLGYDF